MRLVFVAAILAVCSVGSVNAWGDVGHQIVGYIGQNGLNSNAASSVGSILDGQSLTDVATWADQIKRNPAYSWSRTCVRFGSQRPLGERLLISVSIMSCTAPLHYIDAKDWACNYVPTRDCADSMCVAGAISNYTDRVQQPSLGSQQVQEALQFLTHFVGDIHQPLHVGFTTDRGMDVQYLVHSRTPFTCHCCWWWSDPRSRWQQHSWHVQRQVG